MLTDVAPKYDPKFFLQNFSFINNYQFVDDVEISVSIFLDRLGIEKPSVQPQNFPILNALFQVWQESSSHGVLPQMSKTVINKVI